MSQGVLLSISKTVTSQTYKFTDKAIVEVVEANTGTDTCLTCQFHSEYHFDGEDFANASNRLVDLKKQILKDLSGSSPNGKKAREHLGQALHTLQDFYSHSTRIELNLTGFDSQLGANAFSGFTQEVKTCPANPAVLGGSGLTGITSGYFPMHLVIPPPPLPPVPVPVPSPCHGQPVDKCLHGNDETYVVLDTCDGINKDSPTSSSHGQTYYQQAYDAAYNETVHFVTDLILGDSSITNNAKAVLALMVVTTTLGMVVDTTGSMGDVIGQVQARIATIVNGVAGTTDEPEQYLLETFNDPFYGTPFVTSDASTFLAQVNGLFAFGGDDCPELANHGLLAAAQAADPQSTLYFFSDASAKDSGLGG